MSSFGDGRGSSSVNSCRSLEAMGFSKAAAEQALAETNGSVEASINLLLEREGRQQQQREPVYSEQAAALASNNSAGSSAPDIGLPSSCSAPAPSHIKHNSSSATSALSLPSLLLKTSQFASVPPPPDILCDLAFTCEIMDDPVIAVRFKSAAAPCTLPADAHWHAHWHTHSHTYRTSCRLMATLTTAPPSNHGSKAMKPPRGPGKIFPTRCCSPTAPSGTSCTQITICNPAIPFLTEASIVKR